MEPVRKPLKEGGLAFSVGVLLYVVVSFGVVGIAGAIIGADAAQNDVYKYLSYLLPQLCFGAACLIFFRRKSLSPRAVYAPCKWYYFPLALLVAYGMFSLSWVNTFFVGLLQKIGYTPSTATLPSLSGWNLLPAILVIALLPAVFEESLFRGIQVGCMKEAGWGTAPIIFLSGALFSLFHGNPEQTLYQFACGCVYALIAVRSGSVFPTMLAHFANNAAILSLSSVGIDDIPAAAQLPVYLTAGAVLVGAVLFLIFFKKGQRGGKGAKGGREYALTASVGIAICALLWIASLAMGFLQ